MSDENPDRLIELESRIAFLEHLLDQLNTVVTRQQAQLDSQTKSLTRLREQLDSPTDKMPENEKPPHY